MDQEWLDSIFHGWIFQGLNALQRPLQQPVCKKLCAWIKVTRPFLGGCSAWRANRGARRRLAASADRIERINIETGHGSSLNTYWNKKWSGSNQETRTGRAIWARGLCVLGNLFCGWFLHLSASEVITRGTCSMIDPFDIRKAANVLGTTFFIFFFYVEIWIILGFRCIRYIVSFG